MLEQHTIEVMGGPRNLGGTVRSQIELAERIAQGLPRSAALAVRRRLGLTEEELAAGLGVSTKTHQRQAKDAAARLKPAQSDRLYWLERMAAFAEEVLEDRERAHRRLREPQRGLGNLALGDLGKGSNTFTLTYAFTPVPLPASLFLLAPAALLPIRRRAA